MTRPKKQPKSSTQGGTGSDLVTLIGDGRLGTGDVAILVERDRFQQKTAAAAVEVWTLDSELAAHGNQHPS